MEYRETGGGPGFDPGSREAKRARARGLLRELAKIAALGGAYFIWITHCFLALARLDFRAAFEANALVFCLLPAALPYGIYRAVSYVRRGDRALSLPEIIIFSLIMVLSVCFALYRNGFLL